MGYELFSSLIRTNAALLVGSFFTVFSCQFWALAEVGVTPTEIIVGSTGSLHGATEKYGAGLAIGLSAYFDFINSKGGVQGRKIRYISMDDNYVPKTGRDNVVHLVEDEKVFAVTGGKGTGTVKAYLPYLEKSKVPLFFPITGAEALRDAKLPYVFNLRVSFSDEAAIVTNYAIEKLGIKEISAFYQDDAFGESGRNGAAKALGRHGLTLVASGTYLSTDPENIDAAVKTLVAANAKAVYIQAVTKTAVLFVKACRAKGYLPYFLTNSVVGTADLQRLLGPAADHIIVSETLPLPSQSQIPIVHEFQTRMDLSGQKNPDNVMLEGYVAGAWLVRALEKLAKI